ncbi:hypothetical protein F7Q91_17700 [Vibrio chagasii]|uniref:Uncharacterized protein n=1 Tax=Vibrio chagasii TaxID=170679 RepID=A0A7V7NS44_9VIBR|nr:hypothetical protein F7Q91_17700 [Vibrio chagasii]
MVNLAIALYLPLFLWTLASIPIRTTFIITSKEEASPEHIRVGFYVLYTHKHQGCDDNEK